MLPTSSDLAHGFDGYVAPLANEQTVSITRPSSDAAVNMNNNLDDIWAVDDEDESVIPSLGKPKSCTSCGNNITREKSKNDEIHAHDHNNDGSGDNSAALVDVGEIEYQNLGPSLKKVHRDHHTPGYLEGITKSKAEMLQPGFNTGYPIGGQIGKQVGYIIGVLQGLGLTEEEELARAEFSVENLLKRVDDSNTGFWDENADPIWEGIHPVIAKWIDRVEALLK